VPKYVRRPATVDHLVIMKQLRKPSVKSCQLSGTDASRRRDVMVDASPLRDVPQAGWDRTNEVRDDRKGTREQETHGEAGGKKGVSGEGWNCRPP
jgi:hypothetical protein